MKDKKNIDNLFKERFKSFEATPSPHVWKNIKAKLKEQDDRKVIPLWIKFGGIAALLALLFTVGNSVFNSSDNNNLPAITKDNTEIEVKNNKDSNNKSTKDTKTEIVLEDNDASENPSEKNNLNKKSRNNLIKNNNSISNTKTAQENNKGLVVNRIKNQHKNTNIKKPTTTIYKENNTVVSNKQDNNISKKDTKTLIYKDKPALITPKKNAVAIKKNNTKNNNDATVIASETAALKEKNKRSIFDAIDENKEAENMVVTIDNKPDNRWDVTPNIAPIYYNTLSEGSSIDPAFSDNPKKGEVTMSYGVQVSYNLNKRLSVRSGFSNVNLEYGTTGLDLGSGPIASATESINYDSNRNIVSIPVDKGTFGSQNSENDFGMIMPKSTSGEVTLNQEINYYEVPLELKYAVLNKKFGINLIGGFSTLFLDKNEVYITTDNFNDILGKANNLSSLSFTTNVGFGLNYSFSKKIMFNIEPMFKYQLNPYTDSSVNFKPYYFGIYSGLSFKF